MTAVLYPTPGVRPPLLLLLMLRAKPSPLGGRCGLPPLSLFIGAPSSPPPPLRLLRQYAPVLLGDSPLAAAALELVCGDSRRATGTTVSPHPLTAAAVVVVGGGVTVAAVVVSWSSPVASRGCSEVGAAAAAPPLPPHMDVAAPGPGLAAHLPTSTSLPLPLPVPPLPPPSAMLIAATGGSCYGQLRQPTVSQQRHDGKYR